MLGIRKVTAKSKVNDPYSIFTTQSPITPNQNDGAGALGDYELGLKFQSTVPGWILAIKHWKSPSETGPHVGNLWTVGGALLVSVTFTNESATGWQTQALPTPLRITANTTYVVSVNVNTNFPTTIQGLAGSVINRNLLTVADGANGFYNDIPGSFPNVAFQSSNYFRDLVFVEG
jgi:hypothetical protein